MLDRLGACMTYQSYEDMLRAYAALRPEDAPDAAERGHRANGPINLQRALRIRKSYAPSGELAGLLQTLTAPQQWLVLTEVWCGDSAQSIPIIARLAELSPAVRLGILLRDEHPGVMDRYMTEGKRGIPKLVVFDGEGTELFRWGPRPAGAKAVFVQALAEGIPKQQRQERLHLWYGRDRGQAIETELHELLREAVRSTAQTEKH